MTPPSEPEPTRRLWRSPFFWGAVLGLILIPLLRPLTRHEPAPPPVFGVVDLAATTSIQDHRGEALALHGRLLIAHTFFTRCGVFCDRRVKTLTLLRDRLAREDIPVRLLSLSVDPTFDTAERLRAYARAQDIDQHPNWSLVSADATSHDALTSQLFAKHRLGVSQATPNPSSDDAAATPTQHLSGFLVLIDARGQLRGYYGADAQGIDELFHRTRHIQAEDPGHAR